MSQCNQARTRIVRSQEQPIFPIRPGMHYAPENSGQAGSLMTAVTVEPFLEPATPDHLAEESLSPPAVLHQVVPNPPSYLIAQNPLLPDGYQEVIDYDNVQYLNGFLRTMIGSQVECEFLVGTNNIVKEQGLLSTVGINFFVLLHPETKVSCVCDYYALKFVRSV